DWALGIASLGIDRSRFRQDVADSLRSASVLRERMTGPTESPVSLDLAAGTRTLRIRTARGERPPATAAGTARPPSSMRRSSPLDGDSVRRGSIRAQVASGPKRLIPASPSTIDGASSSASFHSPNPESSGTSSDRPWLYGSSIDAAYGSASRLMSVSPAVSAGVAVDA